MAVNPSTGVIRAVNQSNLGARVHARNISWLDLVTRAWGTEFYAPDHGIYQFTGSERDSTDLTDNGIYDGGANSGPAPAGF